MKKAIIIVTACFFLFGFTNSNSKSIAISDYTKPNASSLLTVHNTTTNTTIYSVTTDWLDGNGNPQSYTSYTNIGPGESSLVMGGNLSTYVTVTLTLSHSRSGSLRDWYYDSYDDVYIERGCQNFTNTFTPSLYFYFYGVNHFYLNPTQDC